jgi:type IX secretion system PorP/SprF family membrane protein
VKKAYIILFWIQLLPVLAFGQTHPLADQYLMNFFQVNPAVAGVNRYDPLVINAREQGMSWDKAPSSQSVSYHGKLFKEKAYFNKRGFLNRGKNAFGKVGIGAGLFNYSYGSIRQSGFHLDYSYHVFVGDGRVSFGLAPVFMQFKANFTDDSFIFDENPDDLWIPGGQDPISLTFIDFNAGVHYYSETLTMGISCLQMFNSSIRFKGQYGFPSVQDPITNPDLTRSVYGYGAYLFEINRSFRVEPMVMMKYNTNSVKPFRLDLTTTAFFWDTFETGVSYRLLQGAAAFAGVRIGLIQIRYLFELPLSGKTPHGFASHMIQMGFDLGQKIQ